MEKKLVFLIVIGTTILIWTVAAIFFVCARGVDRRISETRKLCVSETTATVIDVKEVCKRNVDTYNYTWYPVYEYYVNGELIVQKSEIGTGKNAVEKGQQTVLYYNPQNPQMIFVPAENQSLVARILKIMGIMFLICGCLPGILVGLFLKDLL